MAEPAADDGPNILSEAEWRVAELASSGHTNREIATKLYITVSTVEQHLTRVYRKLEVRNRKDLPASLAVNVPATHAARGTSGAGAPNTHRTQNGQPWTTSGAGNASRRG
jgi:DNA-binding NarL/FixJ family response regulator